MYCHDPIMNVPRLREQHMIAPTPVKDQGRIPENGIKVNSLTEIAA
jgi:hypothetical protein